MPQNVIHWWKDNTFHPIKSNKYQIFTATDCLIITILNDNNHKIIVKCLSQNKIYLPFQCICPDEFMHLEPKKISFSNWKIKKLS